MNRKGFDACSIERRLLERTDFMKLRHAYRVIRPKMLAIATVLTLAGVAGLGGCSTRAGGAGRTLELGPESDGKVLSVRDIKTLIVRLPGNATTGYAWKVASVRGDALKASGDVDYKPDADTGGRVGVGGTYSASFRVVSKGRAVISLEYGRPWEKDVPVAKAFTVTIDVEAVVPGRTSAQ
jgi:inhibitor of cysteine peptidase